MARGSVEREVKLAVAGGFELPSLEGVHDGVRAVSRSAVYLDAVYWDTEDLRLLRSGVTLRHRRRRDDIGPGNWTLKLPLALRGSGLARLELTWPGPAGTPPLEAAKLVRAFRRLEPLRPVARLSTERRRVALWDDRAEPLIEVDYDTVSALDGLQVLRRFEEVEVELLGEAPEGLLEAVVSRLVAAGARHGQSKPKLLQALEPQVSAEVEPVTLDRRSPVAEVARGAVAECYRRLLAHDPGVRLGEDPEELHQARVATRRLRSNLATFSPLLPGSWVAEVRSELRWLGRLLGAVRDLDVLAEGIELRVARLGLEPHAVRAVTSEVAAERDRAFSQLLEAMDSDRYAELLETLVTAAKSLPGQPRRSKQSKPARLVARQWRRFARASRAARRRGDPQALHALRIRAKHLRYACEAVEPVVGRPARRLARAAEQLQTEIGGLRDAQAAAAWLDEAAARLAPEAAAVARLLGLSAREEAVVAQGRWPAALSKVSAKKRRRWLAS